MDLTFVRHTTPDVAEGTCYGRTDLGVAASFTVEAETVARGMPRIAHIVTSPLKRCHLLATYLAETSAAPLTVDDRFIEMDFGAWEGRAWSDIEPAQINAWRDDFFNARPHGGESVSMLFERTNKALRDWKAKRMPVLIVTHAGVIKAAYANGERAEDFRTQIEFGAFAKAPVTEGHDK